MKIETYSKAANKGQTGRGETLVGGNAMTAYFSFLHLRGTLAGLTTHDSLTFVSAESAIEWRNAMISRETKLGRKLVDFTFQKRRVDDAA